MKTELATDFFKEGEKYYCYNTERRSGEINFHALKQYTCVKSVGFRNAPTLADDHANVAFLTSEGKKITFFLIHALQHFTSDIEKVKKAAKNSIETYDSLIASKQKEIDSFDQRQRQLVREMVLLELEKNRRSEFLNKN